jgi:pyruvate kinase
MVEKLIAAGANGVRINMSHGTHEEKTQDIERARAAAKKLGQPIAVLVDLSGPKIRTGELKDDLYSRSRRAPWSATGVRCRRISRICRV